MGKLKPSEEEVIQFLPANHKNSLVSSMVIDGHLDDEDVLWLCTNQGLCRYDIQSEEFSTLQMKDGLSHSHLCAIEEDAAGVLWISSYDGISSFDKASLQFQNYRTRDGLSNDIYYNGNKSKYNGEIFFGGKNGVDFFNPKELRQFNSQLEPKLIDFRVDDGESVALPLLVDSIVKEFSHKTDLIEIEYGATRYLTNDQIEYEYKLEGLHENWVYANNQRKVLFNDLAPGNYNLKVHARSESESWSDIELSIPFRIATPWWQWTWIRILASVLVALLIFGYVKWRERKVRNRERHEGEIKRKILELEKKAMLSQMNPHFIFNSMNAIQLFLSNRDNEGAMRYLSKFGKLIRQVLNISAKEVVTLTEDISFIERYLELEKLRYPDGFDYAIHVSPDVQTETTRYPSFLIQPHVEQAVQNCLLNSNGKGRLKISLSRINGHLRALIEDNGALVKGGEGLVKTSDMELGTSIVEERLKHINRKISNQKIKTQELVNDEGKIIGTRVELLIDVK